MHVGLLSFYVLSSSAIVGYISAYSLGLDEDFVAGSEALYDAGDLLLPDIANDYQDFDPTPLMMQAGADGELLPEIQQGYDAAGAVLYVIQILWDLPNLMRN